MPKDIFMDNVTEIFGAITVGAIWGLTLVDVDVVTKIVCTIGVSSVSIIYTIKRYNDKRKK